MIGIYVCKRDCLKEHVLVIDICEMDLLVRGPMGMRGCLREKQWSIKDGHLFL